jgi:hypothetical protein
MASKSESLKTLIEGGLRRYDTRIDLFERCEAATQKGQSIGEIITSVTADHPLVQSTSLDSDSLIVFLRSNDEEPDQRFRYSRAGKRWSWEFLHQSDHDWREMKREKRPSTDDMSAEPRPRSRAAKAELDDDIPF